MVEVTQADRKAAAKILSSAITKGVLTGDFDGREILQAFARHRLEAQAEAHELLKEVLAGACVNYAYIAPRNIERIKKLVGEA